MGEGVVSTLLSVIIILSSTPPCVEHHAMASKSLDLTAAANQSVIAPDGSVDADQELVFDSHTGSQVTPETYVESIKNSYRNHPDSCREVDGELVSKLTVPQAIPDLLAQLDDALEATYCDPGHPSSGRALASPRTTTEICWRHSQCCGMRASSAKHW